jgi:hypothetical protein
MTLGASLLRLRKWMAGLVDGSSVTTLTARAMGWTRTLSVPSPALVEPVPGALTAAIHFLNRKSVTRSTFLIAIVTSPPNADVLLGWRPTGLTLLAGSETHSRCSGSVHYALPPLC